MHLCMPRKGAKRVPVFRMKNRMFFHRRRTRSIRGVGASQAQWFPAGLLSGLVPLRIGPPNTQPPRRSGFRVIFPFDVAPGKHPIEHLLHVSISIEGIAGEHADGTEMVPLLSEHNTERIVDHGRRSARSAREPRAWACRQLFSISACSTFPASCNAGRRIFREESARRRGLAYWLADGGELSHGFHQFAALDAPVGKEHEHGGRAEVGSIRDLADFALADCSDRVGCTSGNAYPATGTGSALIDLPAGLLQALRWVQELRWWCRNSCGGDCGQLLKRSILRRLPLPPRRRSCRQSD